MKIMRLIILLFVLVVGIACTDPIREAAYATREANLAKREATVSYREAAISSHEATKNEPPTLSELEQSLLGTWYFKEGTYTDYLTIIFDSPRESLFAGNLVYINPYITFGKEKNGQGWWYTHPLIGLACIIRKTEVTPTVTNTSHLSETTRSIEPDETGIRLDDSVHAEEYYFKFNAPDELRIRVGCSEEYAIFIRAQEQ